MLEQMERSPRAVFYEKELRERFSEEFQTARDAKLLRSVPTRLDGGTYSRGLAKPYLVFEDEGSLEAFDDEDPEAEPIPLTMADLARWRLVLVPSEDRAALCVEQALLHELVDRPAWFKRRVELDERLRPEEPRVELGIDPCANPLVVDLEEAAREVAVIGDQSVSKLEDVHAGVPIRSNL